MSITGQAAHIILYVQDQEAAKDFFATTLDTQPRLHVPGMSEFELQPGVILGLMPETSIVRLLGDALPDPAAARGTPRAELYIVRSDAKECFRRAIAAGAKELSPMLPRDWGHTAAYALAPDAHVIAFATVTEGTE